MARQPETLYHSTCRLWWPFVDREGIAIGEVPIGGGRRLNHPNLTADPDPDRQGWAGTPGDVRIEGGRPVCRPIDKRAVRIEVRFPRRDPRLVRWVDLAKRAGMAPAEIRALDAAGGGRMGDRWIYRGRIPRGRFVGVEFLDGGRPPHPAEQRFIEATSGARSSAAAFARLGMDTPWSTIRPARR